ncbi:MAG: hypothetical protein ACK4NC_04870 [Candidatus Gracilibacteria bacterium]
MSTPTPPLLSKPLHYYEAEHKTLMVAWHLLRNGIEDEFYQESFVHLENHTFMSASDIAEAISNLTSYGGIEEFKYQLFPVGDRQTHYPEEHLDHTKLYELITNEKNPQLNIWESFIKVDHITLYTIKINKEGLINYMERYVDLWRANRYRIHGKNTLSADIQLRSVLKDIFVYIDRNKAQYYLPIDEEMLIDTFAVLIFLEYEGAITIHTLLQNPQGKLTAHISRRGNFSKKTSIHNGKIYHGFSIDTPGQEKIRLTSPYRLIYKGIIRSLFKDKRSTALIHNTLSNELFSIDIETFIKLSGENPLNLRKDIDKFQHDVREKFKIAEPLIKVSQTNITLNNKYWGF